MNVNLLPAAADHLELLVVKYGHIEIPEDIRIIAWKHTLRPWTRCGLSWVHFLREHGVPSYAAEEFMHYVVATTDMPGDTLTIV